jgi:hypothetical protein
MMGATMVFPTHPKTIREGVLDQAARRVVFHPGALIPIDWLGRIDVVTLARWRSDRIRAEFAALSSLVKTA